MPNAAFEHKEWLSLIDVSGPFLTMPVLNEYLPDGLDALDKDVVASLRLAYAEKNGSAAVEDVRSFMLFVLASVLGYDDEVLRPGAA